MHISGQPTVQKYCTKPKRPPPETRPQSSERYFLQLGFSNNQNTFCNKTTSIRASAKQLTNDPKSINRTTRVLS